MNVKTNCSICHLKFMQLEFFAEGEKLRSYLAKISLADSSVDTSPKANISFMETFFFLLNIKLSQDKIPHFW